MAWRLGLLGSGRCPRLHALPALVDALESRLVRGEGPMPLLAAVRWPDLVGWPQDAREAEGLRRRLGEVLALIQGLQAPLRATLMALRTEPVYTLKGMQVDGPLSAGRLPDVV